ncbi:type II secretion system F family protein [Elusimicrobiota bacterium]
MELIQNIFILKILGGIFITCFAISIVFLLFSLKNNSKRQSSLDFSKLNFTKNLKTMSKSQDMKELGKLRVIISIVVFVIFLFILGNILFSILAALAIFFGTDMYLKRKNKLLLESFDNQLIEALGMIANSVRAGQSLLQSLEAVAKENLEPISKEFENVVKQIHLGSSMKKALSEMTMIKRSKNLEIVVNSINLVQETGGNLGEILMRIAETIRERKKIKGKIDSLTAQGKTSGFVIGAVPFLLLGILYFLEPDIMGLLFTTLAGNIMLFVAICMIFMGMFFINKIVDIDI